MSSSELHTIAHQSGLVAWDEQRAGHWAGELVDAGYRRRTEDGVEIELVVGELPAELGTGGQVLVAAASGKAPAAEQVVRSAVAIEADARHSPVARGPRVR